MFHGGLYIEEFVNFIWKMLLGLVIFQMMILTNTFSILNKYTDLLLDDFLHWNIYEV